ncbi:CAP domain-containing protein [Candidatus Curtissbacteria bacterium]|nr:CAP domain-containing protein [Candidatus Curtissbacteria bacterium]
MIRIRIINSLLRLLALTFLLLPLFLAGLTYSPGNINTASLRKTLSLPHVISNNVLGDSKTPALINPSIVPSVVDDSSSPEVVETIPTPSVSSTAVDKNSYRSIQVPVVGDINGEVNEYRNKNGKVPLNISDSICSIANARLAEIRRDFSHQNWSEPLHALGFSAGAENIAMGSKGSFYVVNVQWAKSPGHNANMLGDYSNGCGVYDGKYAAFLFAG